MSRVVEQLAARYRKSAAGRTGAARRDLLIGLNQLLKEAGCPHGPEREEAVATLEKLERGGLLILERHRRDRSAILRVRLPLEKATALFSCFGIPVPETERARLAALFEEAKRAAFPARFQPGWEAFCAAMAEAARCGGSLLPFRRSRPEQMERIVKALPAILGWEGESLRRFASALLFGDSKFLETVEACVEKCLCQITGGAVNTLAELGVLEKERSFLLHGPARLCFEAGEVWIDPLANPVRLGGEDIRAARIVTSATRCLTVENAAMLHELAKGKSGTLLASSGSEGGYANAAVLAFLRALPPGVELWHFGDSDPKGFDILRDLRERSGRAIRSLHMAFRPSPTTHSTAATAATPATLDRESRKTIDRLLASEWMTAGEKAQLERMQAAGEKGRFEQESLGKPSAAWPFY